MIVTKNIKSLLKDPAIMNEVINSLPIDVLYDLRRKDILKKYHHESSKVKFDRKDLELRYTDEDGRNYYGFPDKLGLPIDRFGKMKFYLMWMASGISPKELDDLLNKQAEALAAGIKDPAQAAIIGMCIEEMRGRKRMTLHTELLYNFLAVQWVRDDEDPLVYNNQIQLEKVESFRKENENGNSYFFFRQKELKLLSSFFRMSEDEFQTYYKESLSHQAFLQAMLQMKFSSATENAK